MDLVRTSARATRRWVAIGLPVLWLSISSCSPAGITEARSALRTNDLPTARELLERDRERHPDSIDVRLTLGEVYYRSGRDALDWEGDQGRYLSFLEKSVDEFVAAAKLEPEDPRPHLYLAAMDLYRGDPEGSLLGLQNCRRLGPGPTADSNLAEVYIYLGRIDEAKRWNQGGYLSGMAPDRVTFNQMLIDWVEGDVAGARKRFEILRSRFPETIRTINMAPLPLTPRSFEQFAGYCCDSPACGPYLERACEELGLQVTRREVSDETLLQELRVEMEKRRRLGEIYQQHKELEIEVDMTEPRPATDRPHDDRASELPD